MKPIYWLAVIAGVAFSIWYVFGRDGNSSFLESILHPKATNSYGTNPNDFGSN